MIGDTRPTAFEGSNADGIGVCPNTVFWRQKRLADEHQIRTTVDLRGLTQLSAAAQSAMGQVVAATLRVRAETKALKDVYAPLGPSAVAGSNAVTAAIAQHEAAVVSATAALKSAKAAVDNLAESEDWGTASWPRISPNDRPRPEQSASLKVG